MKDKAKIFAYSIGVLALTTLVFSLVFAVLYYNNIINSHSFQILNWIFGGLAFLISGFVLGKGINKKALLHAFGVVVCLALLGFLIMESKSPMEITELCSKLLLYLVGSVIAANISKD